MARRLMNKKEEIRPGQRLQYVFVVAEGRNQGAKMFTPEEVRMDNLTIDYQYYIRTQIANQLDELLRLLGFKDYVKNWDIEAFF